MKIEGDGCLLRIFLGESDLHGRMPVYEAIVRKVRELHLAGATVIRGVMGYGAASRIHTAKVLRISDDLPMVVEIIDSREKIVRCYDCAARVHSVRECQPGHVISHAFDAGSFVNR